MEWDLKTKMVQLGNNSDESPEAKEEFQNFVLEHFKDFDMQAWDMFVLLTDINVEEMKGDYDYWEKVYSLLKDVDCNDEKFGLRTGMRIAMIQTICEDELRLI